MGLLGKLFDPIGVFSNAGTATKDLFGGIDDLAHGDFGGAWDRVENTAHAYGDSIDRQNDWANDMGEFALNQTSNWWDKFKRDPTQLAIGAGDPFSARVWGGITGKDYKPYVNQWGGPTEDEYRDAEGQGLNSNEARSSFGQAEQIARPILNYYTAGLGGSLVDMADAYGNRRPIGDAAKSLAGNAALSYFGGNAIGEAGSGLSDTLGVTSDVGRAAVGGAVNGAAHGAVTATAKGDNVLQGTGKGALTGAASSGGNAMLGSIFAGDMPDTGSLGGNYRDEYGENTATMGNNPYQSSNNISSNLAPESSPMSMGNMRQIQSAGGGGGTSPVDNFIAALTGGGNGGSVKGNYGGIASNLLGMYSAYDQRKRMKEQQGQLQNLFTPNSAYAQQARQAVERKDAAAGRRSQYGPREAQLAAMLASKQASIAPDMMKLNQGIGNYQNQMLNNGIQGLGRIYGQAGNIAQDWNSLSNLFGGN